MPPELRSLTLGGPAQPWRALGALGEERPDRIAVTFAPSEPPGIRGWSIPGDVLPHREPAEPDGWLHVDHVVALTGDLDATVDALVAEGLDHRRTRDAGDGFRQAFFLVRPTLLELGGPADGHDGPAFWGLTLVVADLDAAAARLGDCVSAVKDAVQPGRRIATVHRHAGLGLPVALMTPRD